MSDAVSGDAPAWLSNSAYAELTMDASLAKPVLTRALLFLRTWPSSYEEHQGRLVVLCNMRNSRRKMAVPWNSPRGWKLLSGYPVEVQYRTRSDGAFRYRAFRQVGCTNRMLLHVMNDGVREAAADEAVLLAWAAADDARACTATAFQPTRHAVGSAACVDGMDFGASSAREHPLLLASADEHPHSFATLDERARCWLPARGAFACDAGRARGPGGSCSTLHAASSCGSDADGARNANGPFDANARLSLDVNLFNADYSPEMSPTCAASPMAKHETGGAPASACTPVDGADQWSQTARAFWSPRDAPRPGVCKDPESPGAFARAVMAAEWEAELYSAANSAFVHEMANGVDSMDCDSPNGPSPQASRFSSFSSGAPW